MNKAIWIPIEIIVYTISAYLSTKINASKTFLLLTWMINVLPLWVVVAKYSKNLFFDAILYDGILIVTYTIALAYFTQITLKPINMIGLLLLFIAVIMIKI